MLEAYARIQLACEDDVDALLALGAAGPPAATRCPGRTPTCSPGSTTRTRGCRAPDAIEDLCDRLAAFGIRETVQHDDLHDGQVFLGTGVHQVLDWGDACVSHPFFTLSVTLEGVIAWGVDDVEDSEDLEPHLAAYLAPLRGALRRRPPRGGPARDAAGLGLPRGQRCAAAGPGRTRTRLKMFLDGKP